ncbi:MAG: hypothetical protein QNJ27_02060 [Simkaniaceae bacterium]|nr:hypothetical protein [Simkaniaceae bacterium]
MIENTHFNTAHSREARNFILMNKVHPVGRVLGWIEVWIVTGVFWNR